MDKGKVVFAYNVYCDTWIYCFSHAKNKQGGISKGAGSYLAGYDLKRCGIRKYIGVYPAYSRSFNGSCPICSGNA